MGCSNQETVHGAIFRKISPALLYFLTLCQPRGTCFRSGKSASNMTESRVISKNTRKNFQNNHDCRAVLKFQSSHELSNQNGFSLFLLRNQEISDRIIFVSESLTYRSTYMRKRKGYLPFRQTILGNVANRQKMD